MEGLGVAFFCVRYGRRLRAEGFELGDCVLPMVTEARDGVTVRMARVTDAEGLAGMLAEQSEGAFEHFRPHGFDVASIRTMIGRRNWLVVVAEENGRIVGYGFMRSYVHGVGYRGYLVLGSHQRCSKS